MNVVVVEPNAIENKRAALAPQVELNVFIRLSKGLIVGMIYQALVPHHREGITLSLRI
jgi:hypothetical protein